MSAIHDLINQISDQRLRDRLAAEWEKASREKKFGLVFEDHLPELLPLPKAKPRRGDLVCRRQGGLRDVWQVKSVKDGLVTCVKPQDETHPSEPTRATVEIMNFAADEMMVVREFGQPIYPSLVPVDAVSNGPADAPWHTLIEADNYHALQLLDYLYAGQVDCIYIDPPYNTGARDWKYNNDYVDGNDSWRHSKWLAMMQRRLLLAKRLLNPADSVLIVTIDEKEYLRLGLLLEQEFPGATIQMVSSVINPSGAKREDIFSRTDEYIFFVTLGAAKVTHPRGNGLQKEVRWWYLRRTDITSKRGTKKGGASQFYPIYVDEKTSRIVRLGKALRPEDDHLKVPAVKGAVAVFPIREDGLHMNWGLTAPSLQRLLDKGLVRVTRGHEKQPFIFTYISESSVEKISDGTWVVTGERTDGSKIVESAEGKATRATTQWHIPSHDAGQYGTQTLRLLLGDRRFPFPKSLYAVEDALRFFVANKPDALILDFFAGSGTTAHAVMRLNRQDGGRRRSVCVTNNEVAADEQAALAAQGLKPGDDGWEKWGICRHITLPRLVAAITGRMPDGEPIKGDYKFTDEFPMSEGFVANLAYFKLDFLDKDRVTLKRAFREILPILWLKAGAVGPRPELARGEPEPVVFAPAGSNFIVLLEESRLALLLKILKARTKLANELSYVFIVTDSDESFKALAVEVHEAARPTNPGLHVIQLYRDYLVNFMINERQDAAGRAGLGAMPGAQA